MASPRVLLVLLGIVHAVTALHPGHEVVGRRVLLNNGNGCMTAGANCLISSAGNVGRGPNGSPVACCQGTFCGHSGVGTNNALYKCQPVRRWCGIIPHHYMLPLVPNSMHRCTTDARRLRRLVSFEHQARHWLAGDRGCS